jgi:hypothetical protein
VTFVFAGRSAGSWLARTPAVVSDPSPERYIPRVWSVSTVAGHTPGEAMDLREMLDAVLASESDHAPRLAKSAAIVC